MDSGSSFWSILTRERSIRFFHKLQKTFESFSISEKAIFLGAAFVFAFAVFSIAGKVSAQFMVEVPAYGGSLHEGIIGTPRFINPLLATSDADRDITALVYSGLLKTKPDGSFVPDLAQSYTVSNNGLTYSFALRSDAKFQDGTPITSDDVLFTVLKAQDSDLKSPRRASWDGVTVEKDGLYKVTFTLKQPYAPFISNLTMGILPKHVWEAFDSDQFPFSSFNVNPIGSGPYAIESIEKSSQGIPLSMTLKANRSYTLGRPYIETLIFSFYQNDTALADALNAGIIESASNLTPSSAKSLPGSTQTLQAPLTRVFGIFFNQNQQEILAHKEVRKALDASVDKEAIIRDVLQGFGTVADGPLPPTAIEASHDKASADFSTTTATSLLAKAGWKKNPSTGLFELKPKGKTASSTISFSLATANIPELIESAKLIKEDWENLGAQVDVRVFEPSDLNQSIIRTRKYDALLFGMVVGKNPDLYPFWHSSQRNDPGLNVALYTNTKADKILEKMRQTSDSKELMNQYTNLETEMNTDTPAVFLWSPDFIYAVPENLKGVDLGAITTPSDRFANVGSWYVKTDRVWEVFSQNNIFKN